MALGLTGLANPYPRKTNELSIPPGRPGPRRCRSPGPVRTLGATNGNPADPTSIDPKITVTNGAGNLIVGCDEAPAFGSDRHGSHNLVLGTRLGFSSFGGLVAGSGNSSQAPYASVVAGSGNIASAEGAGVLGGQGNRAQGAFAAVSGGELNVAFGEHSAVSGGQERGALGDHDWAAGSLAEED